MAGDKESTLTPETRVPLKAVWFVATLAVSGTVLLFGIYNRLGTIEGAIHNGWTVEDQSVWASEMREANATLKLTTPDPYKIKRRGE